MFKEDYDSPIRTKIIEYIGEDDKKEVGTPLGVQSNPRWGQDIMLF